MADPGLIGGIIAGGIGLAGGVVGTYCSIRNVNGPLERRFMIQAAAVFWVGGSAFLLGLFLLPRPYNFLLWIPYSVLLPLGIIAFNKKQRRIRQVEMAGRKPPPVPAGD